MFNRCWRWRVLFARRSDGAITPSQWGLLQDHLSRCASCRKIAEADGALQSFLNHSIPGLSQEAAAAFDNRVAATVLAGNLRSAPQPLWMFRQVCRHWKRAQAYARALPFGFLAQIGSGAVVAVALTSFFLLPALHSHPPVSARATQLLEVQAQDRERASSSIPMESLLQTPTPRAALLWTNPQPGTVRHRARTPGADAPAPLKPSLPSAPSKPGAAGKTEHLRHSALPDARAFG